MGEMAGGDNPGDGPHPPDERIAELEREVHRYRSLFLQVNDAIIIHDVRGRILDVNPAAARMLGYTREELTERVVHDIDAHLATIPLEERGREWSRIPRGESRRVEGLWVKKDGERWPAEVHVSRQDDGDADVFVAIARDISDRKRHEAALARYQQDLEEEVSSRTADLERLNEELERARDEAEDANRAKSQFLANMSHELRTPLNAIIGYSEMMQEDAADLGAGELVGDLKKIHHAGRHLLELIGNILDLSKIEAGKMEVFREEADLGLLVKGVVDTMTPLLSRAGNRFEVHGHEELGRASTDVTKVRQILFNLLSNASKFTHDGVVTLACSASGTGGLREVRFSIRDTGVGMTPEQLARVFAPFTQADASTTRKYGGTGLGLALSRHLARMLGGDITATSAPGEGTAFEVVLPVRAAESTGKRPSPAALISSEGPPVPDDAPLVLAVDDDPDMRVFLERFLRREGYQVIVASSGEEALEVALEVKDRLMAVTLDVMMPGMDGWAVLSALKRDPDLARVPVIFLTMVDDRGLAFGLGAAEFLSKPVDRRALAAVLRRYRCDDPPCDALIVDDEPNQRDMLARTLSRAGWSVREAENGRVALERVREHRPALILLDLMMPEMDGFTFLDELQRDEQTCRIPVVVITAKSLTADDRARLSGAAAQVFQKGALSAAELLDQVRALLATCELQSADPGPAEDPRERTLVE